MWNRNERKQWDISEERFVIESTLPMWLKSLILGRSKASIYESNTRGLIKTKVAPRAKMRIKKKGK